MRQRTGRDRRVMQRVALAFLLCAAVSASAEDAWLEISTPSEGETVRAASGIVALRGHLGQGPRQPYDVVLAMDQSQSTLLPSGIDLDHDGVLAVLTRPELGSKDVCGTPTRSASPHIRCRPFRSWTTDFDDAVVHAERALARSLVARLEAEGARIGVVSFSGKARIDAGIGAPERALRALAKLPIRHDQTGSNLGGAIDKSLAMLKRARAEGRAAAVLLVTDGVPTAPISDEVAEQVARGAAERARAAKIPVYVFQIRSEEDVDTVLLAEMAERTGGRRIYVDAPGRLSFALPSPGEGALEAVEIQNRTLDRPARATRLYPGGAFDAFVPLAAGENALELRARLSGGGQIELRRTVYFEKSAQPSDQARLQMLLEELRRRTLEAEYAPRPPEPELERRSLRVRTAREGEPVEGEPVAPVEVEPEPESDEP